ncbi:hypothetical protein OR571_05505 [Psychrobacillus sp. NEAU-3TGS]|uniref:hypothetical protein n=1 Tax=Psychrobacillus sp. NEAU-3TGS TaxID=2995412 RepID=UPI00249608B2|nr:hypothetical protein [Psychrobacillus sp. NEAU-3TGS]MDI2586602.1 hypothetical protein [Psychrobacillus sp. NEAU-3TGS]
MNKKVNVGYEEIGYKIYHYLNDVCVFLEKDMDEVFEDISMVSYSDNWHITNTGDIMIHSKDFRSLLIYLNKEKYANYIQELDFILEEESCYEEVMVLYRQKKDIEEKIKTIEQRDINNEIKWEEHKWGRNKK